MCTTLQHSCQELLEPNDINKALVYVYVDINSLRKSINGTILVQKFAGKYFKKLYKYICACVCHKIQKENRCNFIIHIIMNK
jgi:hypothetical protein